MSVVVVALPTAAVIGISAVNSVSDEVGSFPDLFTKCYFLVEQKVTNRRDANKLITNVETGKTLVASAIDPVTKKVYVANYGDDSISVIDGTSNKILSQYSLGFTPVALAVNPITNHLFVINYISGLISIDLGKIVG